MTLFLPHSVYNANNNSNLSPKCDRSSKLLLQDHDFVCDESNKTPFKNNNPADRVETGKNEKKSKTVYITKTGKCYHKQGCHCLKRSKIEVSKDQAKKSNYKKCSKCFG